MSSSSNTAPILESDIDGHYGSETRTQVRIHRALLCSAHLWFFLLRRLPMWLLELPFIATTIFFIVFTNATKAYYSSIYSGPLSLTFFKFAWSLPERLNLLALLQWLVLPRLHWNGKSVAVHSDDLDQPVPCFLYSAQNPAKALPTAAVLYIHGGGFCCMSSKTYHSALVKIAECSNLPVLSVDYTLAPDAKAPTQTQQCRAAYAWLFSEEARRLGLGTLRNVVLMGDSAGGNLSVSVALDLLVHPDDALPAPSAVNAIYPVLSMAGDIVPSEVRYTYDVVIPRAIRNVFHDAYIATPLKDVDETTRNILSPIDAPDDLIAQLPPCRFICGQVDPLIDDSRRFIDRMNGLRPGVDSLVVLPKHTHGWLNFDVIMPTSRRAFRAYVREMAKVANEAH